MFSNEPIPIEDLHKVPNFKYSSTTYSLIYNYFSSPFCEFLVRFIPKTVHPNMVSIIFLKNKFKFNFFSLQ